jgi:DNA repair ATPase RecN
MRVRVNLWIVTALLLLVAAAIYHTARRARGPDVADVLRDSLHVVRAAVDTCRVALDQETYRLEAFDERLDSLRGRVRELERIDPRGVPADSYAVYLEAFQTYNDSVPGWEQRADSLREQWQHCRDLTERHNAVADSLRQVLLERQSGDAS